MGRNEISEKSNRAWPTAAPAGLFDVPTRAKTVTRPWDDDPVGFAIVGLSMGHVRAKQLVETPGTRLVGVCDLIEERARHTGEACGVPYTTEVQKWLDDDEVEVVFVLTETGRHAEVALQALEAGKHVLTTKPMEASIEACDQMIDLAEERGLLLGVDFDRRSKTDVQTLRAAIADGRFGRLLSGNCSLKIQRTMQYFRANGGWRGTRRWDGGGVFSNQSVHHIDEVAYTVGIPSQVRCNIWTQTHEIEAEDLGTSVWLYADGAVITFYATSSYPHPTWYLHYELEGTEGAYTQVSGGPFEGPRIKWYLDGNWSEQAPRVVECAWLNAMDNFAAALRTGADLICSGHDGRRTQAILDAMYRSAYESGGDWVAVRTALERRGDSQ